MAVDVIMPKLGESITEGTILEWKKSVGDMIDKDETLLEISTDKVDSEVPCPAAGKVLEILYNVNDVVAVGEVIARVGGEGETPSQSTPGDVKEEVAEERRSFVGKGLSRRKRRRGGGRKKRGESGCQASGFRAYRRIRPLLRLGR